MAMVERRELERLRYWQGQMLRSRDFRDDGAIEAERRWWHNRALHAAFGINYGLQVAGDASSGTLVLTVSCGLAYDCFGRELILKKDRPAPSLPLGTAAQTLVIQTAAGGAQLSWVATANLEIGDGVPLAQVTLTGGTAALNKIFQPPFARALARPRLATGDTVRGDTPWEPWIEEVTGPDGTPQQQTVGVQTHIDTSAAGFTAVPNYFAELQWPNLANPSAASFAPAFFPSIADAEPDGFTFRLLMKGIARRKVAVAFGVSAVAAPVPANSPLDVSVTDASGFQAGDMVARVKPRALLASTVDAVAGADVTLHSPLDGVLQGDTMAIGNPPRAALVTKVQAPDMVMAFQLNPPPAVHPGDLLVQIAAGTVPVAILDVQNDEIILETPINSLNAGDTVGLAKQADVFSITDVQVDNAGVMTVTVTDPTVFQPADVVFQVGPAPDLTPGPSAAIQSKTGSVLTLKAPINGLQNTDQLGRVSLTATVTGTIEKPMVLRVTVDDASVFRAGDLVARLDAGVAISSAAAIEKIDGKKKLTLSAPIQLDANKSVLGAANAAGSSAVTQVNGASVTVATPAVFQAGDVVVKWGTHDDLAAPSVISTIAGNGVLTLQPALSTLQVGDILVARRFPRPATVLNVFPVGVALLVNVDNSAAFRAGDLAMRVGDAAQTAGMAVVTPFVPGWLMMFNSISGLQAGDQLVPINFNTVAAVAADPADTMHLTIDRTVDFRTGDLMGLLTAYVETSVERAVSRVVSKNNPATNTLSLAAAIDGLIPDDLIGPASLTPTQNSIRFSTADQNLASLFPGDLLAVSGLDPLYLQLSDAQVRIANLDGQTGIAALTPVDGSTNSFRPETLSIAALFNANFTDAFVAFAQQQDLYVCWLGCQNETQTQSGCPGATASVSPCPQKGN
jgi:hypothetical protein